MGEASEDTKEFGQLAPDDIKNNGARDEIFADDIVRKPVPSQLESEYK